MDSYSKLLNESTYDISQTSDEIQGSNLVIDLNWLKLVIKDSGEIKLVDSRVNAADEGRVAKMFAQRIWNIGMAFLYNQGILTGQPLLEILEITEMALKYYLNINDFPGKDKLLKALCLLRAAI